MLRIIDANSNRMSEGLRVLEDVSRLLLNDADLSLRLRKLRHSLIQSVNVLGIDLISKRNAQEDIGISFISSAAQQSVPSLVTANAKRVEEALRVIEELAKDPELASRLSSEDFKRARFELYSLEQILISKLLRKETVARLTGLYVIVDTEVMGNRCKTDTVREAIIGGAKVIQLRDKHSSKRDLLELAIEFQNICANLNVLFIINDHLDIALASNADGLHIGQEDLPVSVARKLLPVDKIIGCSVTSINETQEAESNGADYVAVGSIFSTQSKTDVDVVGIDRLQQVKQATTLPVVAIGGINEHNIPEILTTGVESIAVISAVLDSENIEETTRQLVNLIER